MIILGTVILFLIGLILFVTGFWAFVFPKSDVVKKILAAEILEYNVEGDYHTIVFEKSSLWFTPNGIYLRDKGIFNNSIFLNTIESNQVSFIMFMKAGKVERKLEQARIKEKLEELF